jgi:hypothetical protein
MVTLPSWIFFVLLALGVLGVIIIVFAKKKEVIAVAAVFVLLISAATCVMIGVKYVDSKSEKDTVTALLAQVRPDAQLLSIDTTAHEIHYVPKGQPWPVCVAHYTQKDEGSFYFDTDSVMCEYVRPKDLPPATASTTTTTTPPTTVALFPPSSAATTTTTAPVSS